MGAALGTMVANLSLTSVVGTTAGKSSLNGQKGLAYQNELLRLVDEDTNAFNKIMEAFRLPKDSETDKAKRAEAIQAATKFAIETPFKVMETAYNSMEVMQAWQTSEPELSNRCRCRCALCAYGCNWCFPECKINCGDCRDKPVTDIMEEDRN